MKTEAEMPREAAPIADLQPFLAGAGRFVSPEDVRSFCGEVVDAAVGGISYEKYSFVLGFAACLDAVSRGTIGFADPMACALRAYRDVNNVGPAPNRVTNMMRELPEKAHA